MGGATPACKVHDVGLLAVSLSLAVYCWCKYCPAANVSMLHVPVATNASSRLLLLVRRMHGCGTTCSLFPYTDI